MHKFGQGTTAVFGAMAVVYAGVVHAVGMGNDELFGGLAFGDVWARVVAVAEVDDETEFAKFNPLKTFANPPVEAVIIQMFVSSHCARLTYWFSGTAIEASHIRVALALVNRALVVVLQDEGIGLA